MKCYDISFNNTVVGKACIEKQGLYVKICADCALLPNAFYRLILKSGGDCIDLGVMLPTDAGVGLCTNVSVKKVDLSQIEFVIFNMSEVNGMMRFLFNPTEPFTQLECINELRVENDDSVQGIWLVKSATNTCDNIFHNDTAFGDCNVGLTVD